MAQSNGGQVFPPNSPVYGKEYGEWSAAWWQWILAIPAANSPVNDPTGANCGVNQSGPVWFLAGTTGGDATRACTVPSSRAVMFPIINGECSQAEGNGTTAQQLRRCAINQMRGAVVSAIVDHVPLQNLSQYEVTSPLYTFNAVAGNAFGIAAGSSISVADGYYVIVRPFSPGSHTIQFRGVIGGFETGVTYNLTVTP